MACFLVVLALVPQEWGLVVGQGAGCRFLGSLGASLLGGGLSVLVGLFGVGGVLGWTAGVLGDGFGLGVLADVLGDMLVGHPCGLDVPLFL